MIVTEKALTKKKAEKSVEKDILPYISNGVRSILLKLDKKELCIVEEIRLRAGKPLMIQNYEGDRFVRTDGSTSRYMENLFIVPQEEIIKTLELMSENSIYAYQDEIKNGFITLKGGHRVGIAGRVVLEGSTVKSIKDISGLNIRVSREIQGCADKIVRYVISNNKEIYNTLIISPPQCGKTTALRDIARLISSGIVGMGFGGVQVGIIDERSEIAACYKGVPQNDVGVRTDVLDGCPKISGMAMMLRSMSPRVIITDEIGNQGDKDAIMMVINAGVKIITTAHGYNITELKSRREVISLINEKVFERYIVLSNRSGPGTVEEVIDGISMKHVS